MNDFLKIRLMDFDSKPARLSAGKNSRALNTL